MRTNLMKTTDQTTNLHNRRQRTAGDLLKSLGERIPPELDVDVVVGAVDVVAPNSPPPPPPPALPLEAAPNNPPPVDDDAEDSEAISTTRSLATVVDAVEPTARCDATVLTPTGGGSLSMGKRIPVVVDELLLELGPLFGTAVANAHR